MVPFMIRDRNYPCVEFDESPASTASIKVFSVHRYGCKYRLQLKRLSHHSSVNQPWETIFSVVQLEKTCKEKQQKRVEKEPKKVPEKSWIVAQFVVTITFFPRLLAEKPLAANEKLKSSLLVSSWLKEYLCGSQIEHTQTWQQPCWQMCNVCLDEIRQTLWRWKQTVQSRKKTTKKKDVHHDFIKELVSPMRSMTTDCSEIHYKTMMLISDPQQKGKRKK